MSISSSCSASARALIYDDSAADKRNRFPGTTKSVVVSVVDDRKERDASSAWVLIADQVRLTASISRCCRYTSSNATRNCKLGSAGVPPTDAVELRYESNTF